MTTTTLHHIVRPSTLTENAPLVILLHGYGSDEKDLFSFASELPEELFVISVRAPYPMQPYGNAWYAINFDEVGSKFSDNDQAKESRDLIANFIEFAKNEYPVNPNSISLLGFSQGCILSLATALHYPELINNVIGLSGYVNEDLFTLQPAANYEHLNIYASHGSQDQVVPFDWGNKTPAFLDKLNIKNTFSSFPVGHGVAPQNFYELRDWLKALI